MPLYEFRCPSGHDFEKFYRSIGSAPSQEKCPECGQPGVRLMSAAGLVFKGSGFYITDYGKDGKKDLREATSAAKAADAKVADAKAEAPKSDAAPAKSESGAPQPAAKPPAEKSASGSKTPAPAAAPAPKKPE